MTWEWHELLQTTPHREWFLIWQQKGCRVSSDKEKTLWRGRSWKILSGTLQIHLSTSTSTLRSGSQWFVRNCSQLNLPNVFLWQPISYNSCFFLWTPMYINGRVGSPKDVGGRTTISFASRKCTSKMVCCEYIIIKVLCPTPNTKTLLPL